jgi:uncharacterized membrane protein HdeD (DUF308 family)
MKTSHEDQPAPPQPRSGADQEAGQAPAGGSGYGEPAGPAGFGGSLLEALRPWTALYAAGTTTLILGMIVLIWPKATLVVLALLFGCYLVISGVLSLVEGISHKEGASGMRVAYIVLGILGVLLGLFCLRRIDVTVLVLAFLISAFWIMRGCLDLAAAMSGAEYAGMRALTGALSLIAGILVLFWPGITLTALLIVAGIWLIMYGISLLFLGRQLHKLAKQE